MFRRVFGRILRLRAYRLGVAFLCVVGLFMFTLNTWSRWTIIENIRDDDSVRYRPKIRFSSAVVEDKPHSITRIIHQTWKSEHAPLKFKSWIKSWIELNPEYEYWFWTDEDMRELIEESYPQFLSLYDSYPSQIYRADAFRYFALFEHGGVYADIDTSCLRPIDYTMAVHDCILTQEPLEHAYLLPERLVERPLVSNAIIACRGRHPLMEQAIRQLPLTTGPWYRWNDVVLATGPGVMRTVWKEFTKQVEEGQPSDEVYLADPSVYQPTVDEVALPRMRETCTSLPVDDDVKSDFSRMQRQLCDMLLNPYYTNEPKPESVTDHHWAGTWDATRKQPKETFSILSLKLN